MTEPEEDVDAAARRRAAAGAGDGDVTGWFETLYADAAVGRAVVPWDRDEPHWLLRRWADEREPVGDGVPALVVGCGTGADAAFLAGFGYATVAFDVSPTAVSTARERHPDDGVEFVVADLLDPPAAWVGAFGLVVESMTVQAMPRTVRPAATAAVRRFLAPGGALVVITSGLGPGDSPDQGPPWLFDAADVDAFGRDGLVPVQVEPVPRPAPQVGHIWLAEFRRPG